jgi:hypothetical protein
MTAAVTVGFVLDLMVNLVLHRVNAVTHVRPPTWRIRPVGDDAVKARLLARGIGKGIC